ncbi:MAG TPA: hypothetical protein VM597_12185 [Gemmataceae bacterium]|nr:hypothetical protein [Gemmataceae bacterium]
MDDTIKAVTAFIATLSGVVVVLVKLWRDMKSRLDTFWSAHLLRGKAEALREDLVVETHGGGNFSPDDLEGAFMPLAVRQRAAKLYEKAIPALQKLRAANPEATEVQMAELIERQFGGWIARNVCTQLGINQFACIVMAISLANGVAVVPDSANGE